MDDRGENTTPGYCGLSEEPFLAQRPPVKSHASPDTNGISLNRHNDSAVMPIAMNITTITHESALIAESKQKRLEIFNSEYLYTAAGCASGLTSPISPTPKLHITIEYANMILGRHFKVSRCRTLQALKLSARAKCTKYNAAAISDERLVQDVESFAIDSLAATLAEQRESQRQQLLDLFGFVEPPDPSFADDEATRLRAPAIDPPFDVFIGINIRIGREFYGNAGIRIHDHAPVVIGNHVRLGPNVSLLTEYHPTDAEERSRGDVFAKPIQIGDNVWIGAGATVLGGVKIGNEAIIGAGALVNRNVGEGELVVGVPARVVRKKMTGFGPTAGHETVVGWSEDSEMDGGVPVEVAE